MAEIQPRKLKMTIKHTTKISDSSQINSSQKNFSIVETFVGCGGSHFGLKKAGFKTIFVNDNWSDSMETLKLNDSDLKEEQILLGDIKMVDHQTLDRLTNGQSVDVLMGGVVCKGFSLAGIRNPFDERNYLYLEQLRLVKELKPKISIIENVPGILSMKILKQRPDNLKICEELTEICELYKKKRGEIIALNKKDLCHTQQKEELDQLVAKRKVIEKYLENDMYSVVDDIENLYHTLGYKTYKKVLDCSHYGCATSRHRLFIVALRGDCPIEWTYPEPVTEKQPPTIRDALNQLEIEGINNPVTDIDNRPMTHNPKTIEKFKLIGTEKSKDSYFSRGTSSRLSWDKPAPTLVPGHSSFQIHPTEHRSITIREAALISSFPKDFKFYGSHSSRCVQIGNAIPVNMAYYMGLQCIKLLKQWT